MVNKIETYVGFERLAVQLNNIYLTIYSRRSNIHLLSLDQMSAILEEEWKQTLTFIVDDLDSQQFKKLLELLSKIPKSQKTAKFRGNIPQIIIEHYGLEDSVFAIDDAMEKIPRRDNKIQDPLKTFVEKLKAKEEKNTGEHLGHKSVVLNKRF